VDLYVIKWPWLKIIVITIAFAHTVYSKNPRWGKFIGGGFFNF
jgi:hypothetical protein